MVAVRTTRAPSGGRGRCASRSAASPVPTTSRPPSRAAPMIRTFPRHVVAVGMFVDPRGDDVRRAIDVAGVHLLQFHGDEPAAFGGGFGLPAMKALRVRRLAEVETAALA